MNTKMLPRSVVQRVDSRRAGVSREGVVVIERVGARVWGVPVAARQRVVAGVVAGAAEIDAAAVVETARVVAATEIVVHALRSRLAVGLGRLGGLAEGRHAICMAGRLLELVRVEVEPQVAVREARLAALRLHLLV